MIPDRQWKKERFHQSWYDGETVIASIGQGYILATPLQLATMTAAVANGGTVLRPQVIKRVENTDGEGLLKFRPEIIRNVPLNPAHLKAVREGMKNVVNEPGGTAWMSRLKEIPYAGKTGTAQVVKQRAVPVFPA